MAGKPHAYHLVLGLLVGVLALAADGAGTSSGRIREG